MEDVELIPLRIHSYKKNPVQQTLHQTGLAICEDGLSYYVKGMDGNTTVCAEEWISSSMARSLNLPTPPTKVLQASDGRLVFGSQAITNKLPDIEASMLLLEGSGNLNVAQLSEILSASYAFDQIVHNTDRHDHNYVIQKMGIQGGQESANIQLIDFGGANLLTKKTEELDALPEGSPTVRIGRRIRSVHGFSIKAAESLVERFQKGKSLLFENSMLGLPAEWLAVSDRQALNAKLMSKRFQNRLDAIGQGISDGAYL